MSYHWYDLVGNVGVILILTSYLLLQLEKISSKAMSYSLLNFGGALLILVSLVFEFNLSAFFIELMWALISLIGVYKVRSSHQSHKQ